MTSGGHHPIPGETRQHPESRPDHRHNPAPHPMIPSRKAEVRSLSPASSGPIVRPCLADSTLPRPGGPTWRGSPTVRDPMDRDRGFAGGQFAEIRDIRLDRNTTCAVKFERPRSALSTLFELVPRVAPSESPFAAGEIGPCGNNAGSDRIVAPLVWILPHWRSSLVPASPRPIVALGDAGETAGSDAPRDRRTAVVVPGTGAARKPRPRPHRSPYRPRSPP